MSVHEGPLADVRIVLLILQSHMHNLYMNFSESMHICMQLCICNFFSRLEIYWSDPSPQGCLSGENWILH